MFIIKKMAAATIVTLFSFSLHVNAQVIDVSGGNSPQLRFGHSSGNIVIQNGVVGDTTNTGSDASTGTGGDTSGDTGGLDTPPPLTLVDVYNFNHSSDSWLQGSPKISYTPTTSSRDCDTLSNTSNRTRIRSQVSTNFCKTRFNFDTSAPFITPDDYVSVSFDFIFEQVNVANFYTGEIYINEFLLMGAGNERNEGSLVMSIYDQILFIPIPTLGSNQSHSISIVKEGAQLTVSILNGRTTTSTITSNQNFSYSVIETIAKNANVVMSNLVIHHQRPE